MEFESKGGDSNFLPFLIRTYHDKFLPANFYIYVRETILIFKKRISFIYNLYNEYNYYYHHSQDIKKFTNYPNDISFFLSFERKILF